MARDIQIKVMVSAEEYLAFKNVADEGGESQSGWLRRIAIREVRTHVASMASDQKNDMDDIGHDLAIRVVQ